MSSNKRWWSEYLELAAGRCAYCLEEVGEGRLTREHVVPRSLGGSSEARNMLPCCLPCNAAKANKGLGSIRALMEAAARRHRPHPLGWVVDGVWVWSARARAIQARTAPERSWGELARDSGAYLAVRSERRPSPPLIAIG